MLDIPLNDFQERVPEDVAVKVRFLYAQLQYRVQVRDRAVASLLEEECQIGTRLREVLRAYGWFNEAGERERVQLDQELRNLEKERRKLYEETFKDIHEIKAELVEALIEYRALRRRDDALVTAGQELRSFDERHVYLLPGDAAKTAPSANATSPAPAEPAGDMYRVP